MKRLICAVLTVCMLVSLLPVTANAKSTKNIDDLYWEYPAYLLPDDIVTRYYNGIDSAMHDVLKKETKWYYALSRITTSVVTTGLENSINDILAEISGGKITSKKSVQYRQEMAMDVMAGYLEQVQNSKLGNNGRTPSEVYTFLTKVEEVGSAVKKEMIKAEGDGNDVVQYTSVLIRAGGLSGMKNLSADEIKELTTNNLSKITEWMGYAGVCIDAAEILYHLLIMYEVEQIALDEIMDSLDESSCLYAALSELRKEIDRSPILYFEKTFLSAQLVKKVSDLLVKTAGTPVVIVTKIFKVWADLLGAAATEDYANSVMRLGVYTEVSGQRQTLEAAMMRACGGSQSQRKQHTILYHLQVAALLETLDSLQTLATSSQKRILNMYSGDEFLLPYDEYIDYCVRRMNDTISTCKHEGWSTTGYCYNCNKLIPYEVLPSSGYKEYARPGRYSFSGTEIKKRQFPHSGAPEFDNKNSIAYLKETIKTKLGEIWYRFEVDGTSFYTSALPTLLAETNLAVKVTSLSVPTKHTEGSSYHIKGGITLEGFRLTSGRAYFLDSQGKEHYSTGKISLSGTKCTLNGSKIDKALKFAKLAPGTWKYAVEFNTDAASDAYKQFVMVSKPFTVAKKPPEVKKPAIKVQTSWDGGCTCRITNPESKGKLSYSFSGTAELANGTVIPPNTVQVTGNSYVDVRVTSTGTFKAFCTSADKRNSKTVSSRIVIPQLEAPTIRMTQTAHNAYVTLEAEAGATIFYRMDEGDEQKYTGTLTLTEEKLLTARAIKNGCIASEEVSQDIFFRKPDVPQMQSDVAADVPVRKPVSLHWAADELAGTYQVSVTCDGEEVPELSAETAESAFGFVPEKAGVYQVSVTAKNFVGSSQPSDAVTFTAHEDVTATFLAEQDGTPIAKQQISYGGNADPDAIHIPARRGYTFRGWKGQVSGITTDVTIVADYERNSYLVRYYDTTGEYMDSQRVLFGDPIASEAVEARLTIKEGYCFQGWTIAEADAESARDIHAVDSAMKLMAVQGWENEELPAVITDLQAVRRFNSTAAESTGYEVSFKMSSISGNDTKAKVILSLFSENGQMLGVTILPINSMADTQDAPYEAFIFCNGIAARLEASVMAVSGTDRTGGVIAETVSCTPSLGASSGAVWSDWQDEQPEGMDPTQIQSKTVYRYRDNKKETVVLAENSAPEGYTFDTTTEEWGNWSAWQDGQVTASDSREVETQTVTVPDAVTEYRYGRWSYNGTTGACPHKYGKTAKKQYTDWSTKRTKYRTESPTEYTCGYPAVNCGGSAYHIGAYKKYNNRTWWRYYDVSSGNRYYWEETRKVDGSKTQYRYRDLETRYVFYRWVAGTWSAWEDTAYTAGESRDVETRTVYRYVIDDPTNIPQASTDVPRTVEGSLALGRSLEGKKASLLVYKTTNSDPTESQMEYIGQTTLGADNSYSFTNFITREAPSLTTGSFIMALAVEGCDGPINIGVIEAPKPTYTVTFYDEAGTMIGQPQVVPEGEAAIAPEISDVNGKRFVCWNKDFSDIRGSTEIFPVYVKDTYAVAFVDYLNATTELTRFEAGGALCAPSVFAREGFIFGGWIHEDGTGAAVTLPAQVNDTTVYDRSGCPISAAKSDMVVTANWIPAEYTVSFLNEDGTELSSQKVRHGESATPPPAPVVPEGKVFLGWDTSCAWWRVTEDLNVQPLIAYVQSADVPVAFLDEDLNELTLTAKEGAAIYYTLDGSDPYPEEVVGNSADSPDDESAQTTYLYDGSIFLQEGDCVRAIAVEENANNSQVIEVVADFSEETDYESVEIGKWTVGVAPGDEVVLECRLSDPEVSLASYLLTVQADPTVFCLPHDDNNNALSIESGDLCENNGGILLDSYQPGVGWTVLWVGENATDGTGTLLRVKLKVLDTAQSGYYPIKVSYSPENTVTEDDLAADEEMLLTSLPVGGADLLGDVNGDGSVTTVDVIHIARHVIGNRLLTDAQQPLADVTGDGKITNADVVRLARYILGATELR